MNIISFKRLKNGMYSIKLDDNNEISLYQEVILEYELLIKKSISSDMLLKINSLNKKWEVYYVGLKLLKSRFRSRKELFNLLVKKEYSNEDICDALDRLESQGYINDLVFSKSYINNQILTTNRGPRRIINDLLDKGVSLDIIEKTIVDFSDELEKNRISKQVDKFIKSNRNKSGKVLKMKIINDLLRLGYNKSAVDEVVGKITFSVDKDLAKKEYDKLYRKYSQKYSGSELEYRIKQKLYQKGLIYED